MDLKKTRGIMWAILAGIGYGFHYLFYSYFQSLGGEFFNIALLWSGGTVLLFIPALLFSFIFSKETAESNLKIKDITPLLLLGTLYATVFYLEMEAFNYLNGGVVDAIIFSSPLFLMLLYKIFDKAIFSKTIYFVIFFMVFAVYLMSDDQKASYPGHSLTGIFICLLAIIVYCFFFYFLDKVQSNQTIMPFFVIMCGCLISVLTAAFLFGKNMQVIPLITTDGSLLYAFLFCLLSGVLPVISLGYSMRYIPPVLVDILQVFQPITSTLAGAFLLMEHITYPTLCGMALSLLVCLYITISGTVCSK